MILKRRIIYCLLLNLFLLPLLGCSKAGDANDPKPANTPAPSISSFIATPNPSISGGNVVLTAIFSDGTGVINQNVGAVTSGVSVTVNPTKTTTYTLTVNSGKPDLPPAAITLTVNIQSGTGYQMGGAIQGAALNLSGVVTTFAGATGALDVSGTADGIGIDARFNTPGGITTDGSYLYVSDSLNSTIRQIEIASGQVSTLA
ncbi:MAG: hypothetical protein ACC707_21225, partial [Thiohalomonadales bacterium]